MADDVAITAGAGTSIATDDCTSGHAQVVKLAYSANGDRTHIPADASGLLVNLGTNNDVTVAGTVAEGDPYSGNPVVVAGINGADNVVPLQIGPADALLVYVSDGSLTVSGDIAHDSPDSTSKSFKIGAKAIAHGTNPTAVAAADRTDIYANRAGIPFVMGGHPNIVTVKHTTITTAVTDAAVITIGGGLKIVVTSFQITLDNASTVFPSVLLGFGTANTPTTTGVIGSHGGVPAGGGFGRGDGSGIIGIGADGEDLRITTVGNATGNGLQLVVTYYTIES
jgi:hypothetical protein